jgi:hypothetical protein
VGFFVLGCLLDKSRKACHGVNSKEGWPQWSEPSLLCFVSLSGSVGLGPDWGVYLGYRGIEVRVLFDFVVGWRPN